MSEENLWGPVKIINWMHTPCIKSRVATEIDVKEGRAVFFIKSNELEHMPIDISIPSIAYRLSEDGNERTLVIVIQAEKAHDREVIGERYLEGGNGVCLLSELDFIKSTSE